MYLSIYWKLISIENIQHVIYKNNTIFRGSRIRPSSLNFTRSSILVELELRVLVFVEAEKPENPEKNARTKSKPNPHTKPRRHRSRATVVGGELCHNFVSPVSQIDYFNTK